MSIMCIDPQNNTVIIFIIIINIMIIITTLWLKLLNLSVNNFFKIVFIYTFYTLYHIFLCSVFHFPHL